MVINQNYRKAVILTALRVEFEAVSAHLKDLIEEVHPQGTIYEKGFFPLNNPIWEVGIAEIGAGNEGAALEAERAIRHFNPEIIFFVGVAGGVKDVAIGDVVVANKVYSYESGKADKFFMPRPNLGQPKYHLVQRVKAEARKDKWLSRLSDSISDQRPRIFVEPIAAGEKVISSTRSATYEFIRSNYNDAVAVEMEGYGFLTAAYANPEVDALVIRGISDLINNKAQTDRAGMQILASQHASAFAFEILTILNNSDITKKVENKKINTLNNHPSNPKTGSTGEYFKIFKEIYEYAHSYNMGMDKKEAEVFATNWMNKFVGIDFKIFKEIYEYANSYNMGMDKKEAEVFATNWMNKFVDIDFKIFKEIYEYANSYNMGMDKKEAVNFTLYKLSQSC